MNRCRWVRWGLLTCLFMGVGCGLPPCFEGELRLEVLAIDEAASSCNFEGWPSGTELVMESTGNWENLGDLCRRQTARYVERPERGLGQTISTKPGSTPLGFEIAFLEGFSFDEDDCSLYVSGSLFFSVLYDDVESALEGQARGNNKAFFIRHDYSGSEETCGHLFPAPVGQNPGVGCDNTQYVRITRR